MPNISTLQFWQETNKRFVELENELDLRDFSFIVYGFVKQNMLNNEGFLKCSYRALLRNSKEINWKDFSMIMLVSE
jgi:hypothetical protein